MGKLLGSHDCEGVTLGLSATSPADAVNVILGVLGNVVIDDMTHPGYVDAARSDIGGDHHLVAARFESLQRIDTLLLGAVGMHNGNLVVFVLKLARNTVGTVLGATKNDDAMVIGACEHRLEEIEFLGCCHRIEGMLDGLGGRAANTNGNFVRIAKAPGRKTLDLLWNSGREEKRLTLLRTFLDDAPDIRKEAHIEHPVDLVEDKHL